MGEVRKMDTKKFLEEYEALCKKHNMFVDACGCCNSPDITTKEEWDAGAIMTMTFEEAMADNVKHLSGG